MKIERRPWAAIAVWLMLAAAAFAGESRLAVWMARAVDGDTADVEVYHGRGIRSLVRIRLLGIDTPEKGQPKYAEAIARMWELAHEGDELHVRWEQDKNDSFGRWLVWLYQGDLNIGEQLVKEGLAKHYERRAPEPK